jgi:hypothetical protein
MKLKEVFGVDKPIIGMLHLSGYGREKVLDNAKREMDILYRNGVNAILVENYFGDRVDVENALKYLQETYPDRVYGVNMLGFPEMAFDLARKYGARFVQMDSVCGHLEPIYEKPFLKKLEAMGPKKIVITGIPQGSYVANYCYESGREPSIIKTHRVGTSRCGTGDIFSSIVAADAVNGVEFYASVRKASLFIKKCILKSIEYDIPLTDGVCFEEILYKLK